MTSRLVINCLKPILLQRSHFRKTYLTSHISLVSMRGLQYKSELIDSESGLPLVHAKKGSLVYAGSIGKSIKYLKLFSLTTSILASCTSPIIFAAARDESHMKAIVLASISGAFFCSPLWIHFVTKKYVSDIYFNENTKVFTLTTRNIIARKKELKFIATDVEIPFVGGLFVTHQIKGKPFFLEKDNFRSKEIYKYMVGYDKPMDWVGKNRKEKKFGIFDEEEVDEKSDIKSEISDADVKTPNNKVSQELMSEEDEQYKRQRGKGNM